MFCALMANNSIEITVATNARCQCNQAVLYQMVASYERGQIRCQDETLELHPDKLVWPVLLYWPFPSQKFISECIVIWRFVKEHWSSLSSSGIMAVNFPEGCWQGRCSDVTLQDVWRKEVWGTTDITWHHPTSQLASDFSEGCENILYQVKVQGRLQGRKKLYCSRENESIASSYIMLKLMVCPLLFSLWLLFV